MGAMSPVASCRYESFGLGQTRIFTEMRWRDSVHLFSVHMDSSRPRSKFSSKVKILWSEMVGNQYEHRTLLYSCLCIGELSVHFMRGTPLNTLDIAL